MLAQVGGHAAMKFARRLEPLGLTPPDVGLLRLIAREPGRSQRSLATALDVVPSRVVSLIDGLAERDLVERRVNPSDRRNTALHLTEKAEDALAKMRTIGGEHEDDLLDALDDGERAQLNGLLDKIVRQQGLQPGVHPGFQFMGGRKPRRSQGGKN
ncbi:MarR family winged helix-turn-helix transcriptional regulator [Salininema proteolyticum]|uniref:MarR family winged helix-turn-helix transcriptional regulator n=1 Tax=Salininema proteolyticum TaxID=1607685 RepID=A0ABV8U5Q9_9ACTN